MKKKFTKERFYKKLDAQTTANFDPIEWVQSLMQARQDMLEARLGMNAMQSKIRQILKDINHIKEHGTLPEKPKEYVIHSGENINRKIPPISTGGRIIGHDGLIKIVT